MPASGHIGSQRYRKEQKSNNYFQGNNYVTVNCDDGGNRSKNILPVKSINFLNKKNPLIKDDEDSPLTHKRESRGSINVNIQNTKSQVAGLGFKSAISKIKIFKKKS